MTMHLWKIVALLALLAALAESRADAEDVKLAPLPFSTAGRRAGSEIDSAAMRRDHPEEEWVVATYEDDVNGVRTWGTAPKSLDGVCGTFVLHAGTAMTFSAGQTMIDGGNIGIHPGTAITGTYETDHGGVVMDTMVSTRIPQPSTLSP
jgi:hypothetical protein